jgi:hypothetical protein
VVLLDHIDDLLIEPVLEREIHAFFHMRDDHQRAHRRREFIVRVSVVPHVFREVIRLHQLADVVKIGAHPDHRGVRADRLRGSLREIRDHEAVVVGAGRLNGHPLEQRVIEIREFQPGDVRGDAERALQHRQRTADDECGDDRAADGEERLPADHPANASR